VGCTCGEKVPWCGEGGTKNRKWKHKDKSPSSGAHLGVRVVTRTPPESYKTEGRNKGRGRKTSEAFEGHRCPRKYGAERGRRGNSQRGGDFVPMPLCILSSGEGVSRTKRKPQIQPTVSGGNRLLKEKTGRSLNPFNAVGRERRAGSERDCYSDGTPTQGPEKVCFY